MKRGEKKKEKKKRAINQIKLLLTVNKKGNRRRIEVVFLATENQDLAYPPFP